MTKSTAYTAAALAILKQAGLGARTAGLIALPGSVALSYLLNRSFVFRPGA